MLYQLGGPELAPLTAAPARREQPVLGFIRFDEVPKTSRLLHLSPVVERECGRSIPTQLESHEGFDLMMLHVPCHQQPLTLQRLCIYFEEKLLLFVCDDTDLSGQVVERLRQSRAPHTLERVLYAFLDQLTVDDVAQLDAIEQDISDLEDQILLAGKVDYTREIVRLRKGLMVYKRYYEQLLDVSEALEENENGLISETMLRYFHILTNRVDRLYHNVLNLRDYVTQVRESYQAQVDIQLNSLMKLFTVLTAVFLPLTLIAGWYGMNFDMPEYRLTWGYPLVIVVSLGVVSLCLVLFKRNKWL